MNIYFMTITYYVLYDKDINIEKKNNSKKYNRANVYILHLILLN